MGSESCLAYTGSRSTRAGGPISQLRKHPSTVGNPSNIIIIIIIIIIVVAVVG